MTEHRKRIVRRFPEEAERINRLAETNPAFDTLCREYNDISGRLDSLHGDGGDVNPDEHDRLHRRRAALEQELLQFMSANLRS